MTADEVLRIIANARASGTRVELRGAMLAGANLAGANLEEADLCRADLRGAMLAGAQLFRAQLYRADLREAQLSGADLRDTDLRGTNLRDVNLWGTDLSGANLWGTDLSGANLSGVNLWGVNLSGANLSGANLSDANLSGAKLWGVIGMDALVAQRLSIVPEVGAFEGFKQLRGKRIAHLGIPAHARRSNATTRQCRAEKVNVLAIWDANGAEVTEGVSLYAEDVFYRVGETVVCDAWDDDRWIECGGGIHFYLSRLEAEHHL